MAVQAFKPGKIRSSEPELDFSRSAGAGRHLHGAKPSVLESSTTEHPATVLAGPRIELGTERESLLQVLDEDADFGGQPAAGRSNRKDRHSSFERSQKT